MNKISQVIIIAVSLILALFTLTGNHGLLRLLKINREISKLAAQNSILESEIVDTKNKIFALSSSDFVLEKNAREQLGLAKPGEIVYIFSQSDKHSNND